MGAAPGSGIPGAPRGPTCLSTSTEFSSIATLSSSMRRVEIRMVLEDPRRGPDA
jgi:hypothetical protein